VEDFFKLVEVAYGISILSKRILLVLEFLQSGRMFGVGSICSQCFVEILLYDDEIITHPPEPG